MTATREADTTLQSALELLASSTGIDTSRYARLALERRIRRALGLSGFTRAENVLERLKSDDAERERFAREVLAPPMPMWRRPSFFRALRSVCLPLLRTFPSLNVWLVGCGTGEQAYALSILFREEGIAARTRIYATDPCAAALSKAREGVFDLTTLADEEPAYRESGGKLHWSEYFVPIEGDAVLRPDLRDNIVFAEHNWATDASFNEFQLVVCRDLLIRFGRALQERAFSLIDDSLCRSGLLCLGHGESLRLHAMRERYEPVPCGERVYRRTS
jgi:chemotaxis protein methyltransferase CheR